MKRTRMGRVILFGVIIIVALIVVFSSYTIIQPGTAVVALLGRTEGNAGRRVSPGCPADYAPGNSGGCAHQEVGDARGCSMTCR